MDFRFMDFSLIWTILFQYFVYMAFFFMDFSLIYTILAGTNVVHISGIGCIYSSCNFHMVQLNDDLFRIDDIDSSIGMVLVAFGDRDRGL